MFLLQPFKYCPCPHLSHELHCATIGILIQKLLFLVCKCVFFYVLHQDPETVLWMILSFLTKSYADCAGLPLAYVDNEVKEPERGLNMVFVCCLLTKHRLAKVRPNIGFTRYEVHD